MVKQNLLDLANELEEKAQNVSMLAWQCSEAPLIWGGRGAVEGDAKESKDGGELTEAAQAPQGGRETVKGGAAR